MMIRLLILIAGGTVCFVAHISSAMPAVSTGGGGGGEGNDDSEEESECQLSDAVNAFAKLQRALEKNVLRKDLVSQPTPFLPDPNTVFLMDMHTQIDDPTSGSFVNDLSGKENHAQVHGSPIFHRCKSVTAGCMNALEFAAEDRLTVSHSESLNIAKQITMEAWAQTTNDRAGYIMFKPGAYGFPKFVGDKHVFSYLHLQELDGVGYPRFSVKQPEATDGNWHYFALTYDGKVIRYYLDGELSHKMNLADTIRSSDNDIVIGHSQGANTYPDGPVHFAGKISALRISNRARSPDEIQHSARVGKYLLRKK